ncbi:glycosyltransferase family 2 protein [Alkalilimnicola ehrlichii]|uniref:glycosyltransferase family 2 protein n=1 Tax=Alkalilimnicola ehrlichii TaxID=351052 RepID=UPI00216359BF|nr:glycosyltransferase family 2 protein [Alkalilimnicola ehrlichii]
MDLSIVVPVYNESENIDPLLSELDGVLADELDYEVIFVDDGSTDNTFQLLSGLTSQYPRLRVLRHPQNLGQSAALLTGVRAAQADWVASLDGDGQNDPADLLQFWRLAKRRTNPPGFISATVASERTPRPGYSPRALPTRSALDCCGTARPTPTAASNSSSDTCF